MGEQTLEACPGWTRASRWSPTASRRRAEAFLRGSGMRSRSPPSRLIEIGAGGGSIAHRLELCTNQCRPESSGARRPGKLWPRRRRRPRWTSRPHPGDLNPTSVLGRTACRSKRAAPQKEDFGTGRGSRIGRLARRRRRVGTRRLRLCEVVNEKHGGRGARAIAARGPTFRPKALGDRWLRGPGHAWQSRRKSASRDRTPAGRLRGPAPSACGWRLARVDRVDKLQRAMAGADFAAATGSSRDVKKESPTFLRITGAGK